MRHARPRRPARCRTGPPDSPSLLPSIPQQATTAAGWPSAGGEGPEHHDEHHVLAVLDESVGPNYELLRRSESLPTAPKRLSVSSNGGGTKTLAPHGGGIALGGVGVAGAAATASASSSLAAASSASWRDDSTAHHGHGGRPSFRVIGVQISHLSRTGQFLFCTLGVFSFLLVYGFLQEYMVIHVFQRKLGIFLTFCQFGGYSSLAAVHRVIHADTPRRIPLGYYILLATLQATMQGLTNLSMRWLNYPAKMLFKSSRVIPTMMVGMLYMKKRYQIKDYVVVALLSLGLVFFMQADVKVSPSFHPLGIIFICMALAVDAAIVNLQEFTLRKYDASHDELIFYSYGLGSFILLFYCLVSMELYEGVLFLHEKGAKATLCLVVFCSCGYFGVTCVAALTKKFGALASTMTTTARKALTLFLSFFIFPKPATGMHVFGGILFVLGLAVKAVPTGSSGSSSSRDSGPTSSAASARAALKQRQMQSLLSSSSSTAVTAAGNKKGSSSIAPQKSLDMV